MATRTYTKRTNARRAGVRAGIPEERLVITVHKDDEGVRFGFADIKADQRPVIGAIPALLLKNSTTFNAGGAESTALEIRNGIRRPKPGGVCRAVWDWLDMNPAITAKAARTAAGDHGWNANNVSCEYYAWRKFHGLSKGRANSVSGSPSP